METDDEEVDNPGEERYPRTRCRKVEGWQELEEVSHEKPLKSTDERVGRSHHESVQVEHQS